MNQILGVGFAQPLDPRFPTSEVLHQGDENIAPLTTFLGLAEIVHWCTSEIDSGIRESLVIDIFEVIHWKMAMI
jgi:hypothetical protein